MPNSTEELLNEIWEWDGEKARLMCKMIRCCPENLAERVEDDAYKFEEGGIAHRSMQYYLHEHFKNIEGEKHGKDDS